MEIKDLQEVNQDMIDEMNQFVARKLSQDKDLLQKDIESEWNELQKFKQECNLIIGNVIKVNTYNEPSINSGYGSVIKDYFDLTYDNGRVVRITGENHCCEPDLVIEVIE